MEVNYTEMERLNKWDYLKMARRENQEKAVGKYDINKYEGKREQRYFYKRERPNQEEATF